MEIEFHEIRFLMHGSTYPRAKAWAEYYLATAEKYRKDWNYGNAIHHANLILGRIALKEGNVAAAKDYFLKAGQTPGSPQLNTFGPNMMLAKELLELGEKDVVLEYMDLCTRFWQAQLREMAGFYSWQQQIINGEIPDFKGNLMY